MKSDIKEPMRDLDRFIKLDPVMKYCLVDTMVVLPLHQGDADVLGDVKQILNNAILVLLDNIVYEAAYKHVKLAGTNGTPDINDFVASLFNTLGSAGIKFKLVRLGPGIWNRSKKMLDDEVHSGLSRADYTLLLATIKRQDMDIITADKELIEAINSKRGQDANGKIHDAMKNYNARRATVAWSIKLGLGKFIPKDMIPGWDCKLGHTEFLIGKAKVASVRHKDGNTSVDLLDVVNMPDNNLLVLQYKLSIQIKKTFLEWKPKTGKGNSTDGPTRKKDWHGAHKNDDVDGLSDAQMKSVARKLKNKGIKDMDF